MKAIILLTIAGGVFLFAAIYDHHLRNERKNDHDTGLPYPPNAD